MEGLLLGQPGELVLKVVKVELREEQERVQILLLLLEEVTVRESHQTPNHAKSKNVQVKYFPKRTMKF